jgi:hypothetical protein
MGLANFDPERIAVDVPYAVDGRQRKIEPSELVTNVLWELSVCRFSEQGERDGCRPAGI